LANDWAFGVPCQFYRHEIFSETMALARLNTPWRDADEEKDMHVSDGSYLCGRTSSSSSPVSSRTAMATARLGG
jgi:hypothetical protein